MLAWTNLWLLVFGGGGWANWFRPLLSFFVDVSSTSF